jgi:hypothetical protein
MAFPQNMTQHFVTLKNPANYRTKIKCFFQFLFQPPNAGPIYILQGFGNKLYYMNIYGRMGIISATCVNRISRNIKWVYLETALFSGP